MHEYGSPYVMTNPTTYKGVCVNAWIRICYAITNPTTFKGCVNAWIRISYAITSRHLLRVQWVDTFSWERHKMSIAAVSLLIVCEYMNAYFLCNVSFANFAHTHTQSGRRVAHRARCGAFYSGSAEHGPGRGASTLSYWIGRARCIAHSWWPGTTWWGPNQCVSIVIFERVFTYTYSHALHTT